MKANFSCYWVSIAFMSLLCVTGYAQSNRVGIGTQTPHPNTILHLQSANNNQGLMLTRLTPPQMNAGAMVNNLTMTEKGLVVYDSVRNGIFMWDGTRWKGSWVMRLPYADSLENGPNNTNLLSLKYKGNTGASVGIFYAENQDAQNAFAPIFALSNSLTGGAANLVSSNAAGTGNTLSATQNGLGRAGRFVVNNTGNTAVALQALSNGGSGSAALLAENTGTGAGILSITNGTGNNTAAIFAEHRGSGAAAGVFRIAQNTNNSPALFAQTVSNGDVVFATTTGNGHGVYTTTSGSGNALFAAQTGSGRAVQGQITNPTNTEAAIRGFTDGLGRAGFFTVSNPANTAAALFATHNGAGSTLHTENTGNGNALFVSAGGMRLAVTTVSGGTTIAARTPVYDITGGVLYNFTFPLTNGEMFLIYNRTGNAVTVNSISIPANSGVTCIVLGNALRAL